MLQEGLYNIDNFQVIVGITEEEEIDSLDALLQVSTEGFSTSARVLLLQYCEARFGHQQTMKYLLEHDDNPCLAWARKFFEMPGNLTSEPDEKALQLIQAIYDGDIEAIVGAVVDGGRVITTDMVYMFFSADLSDVILRFLFVYAMSLKLRCITLLSIVAQVPKHSNTTMYDALCNAVTILVDLLVQDKGIIE